MTRAMILAAGLGTRMRPLTDTLPKALVPVAGRPLIEYALLFVKSHGIEEVVLNLHHLGHLLREALGAGGTYGLRITYSAEDPILDTGGGIKKAQPFLDGEPFLVLNADTILDFDLTAFLAAHRRTRAIGTLLLRPNPDEATYGLIETDRTGAIRRIRGEPSKIEINEPLSRFMFTGCQVLAPRIFEAMPVGRAFSTTHELYPQLIHRGETLQGFVHSGPWMVVDDADGIKRATKAIVSGQLRLSYLRP